MAETYENESLGSATAGPGHVGSAWQRVAGTLEGAPFLAAMATNGGPLLTMNPAGRRLLGLGADEDISDLTLADLHAPAARDRLVEDCVRFATRFGHWAGESRLADAVGSEIPAAVLLAAQRGSEREDGYVMMIAHSTAVLSRAEWESGRLNRLDVLGRLAGGMAHDFCNALMPIVSYGELLRGRLAANGPLWRYADRVVHAANQAALLPQWLLAMGRTQAEAPRALDLNDSVARTVKLVRRGLGEDIELTTDTDALPAWVQADPGLLEHALVSLVLSARDAMPCGGTLTISTENVAPGDAAPELDPGTAQRHYVLLTVAFVGRGRGGSAEAVSPEAHDPEAGITQRAQRDLATIDAAVRQAGGIVRISSAPGAGTTVRVLLPSALPATPDAATGAIDSPRGAGEVILVVEDQEDVRRCVVDTLEASGYTVLEASCGSAALRLADESAGRIHLVLTDVVMPGMNGRHLAERLALLRPDVPVLFMSAYPADVVTQQGVLLPGVELLRKPFRPSVLARKVRQVLERSDLPTHSYNLPSRTPGAEP